MNNRNTRKNDVVYTPLMKINLDFGTGFLWIMDHGMHGILMSIFIDFIALKAVFSNVAEISFCLESVRQVFI